MSLEKINRVKLLLLLSLLTLWALALPPLATAAPAGGQPVTPQELRLGQRMYREGILPSGERLKVSMKGETAVPGLTFTCASCHLRSGLGAYDEGVYTPAVNGDKLFRPLPRLYKGIKPQEDLNQAPLRPAYSEASLAEVLRSGKDPNGRVLSDAMPRYQFDDREVKLLTAYLKTLSATASPGVSEKNIHFATVISEGVRPELKEAMLSSFAYYFNMKNNQIRSFSNPRSGAKSRLMAENMFLSRELTDKGLSLARWVLKGPPESWQAQLEEYNRKEPAFALLGGVVEGPWQPVHRFCEENEIPCLFPNTEVPVVSDSDWYTLYQSKGYYQEGDGAARFLSGQEELWKGRAPVQLVRDTPEARALAAGFAQTWHELGHPEPVTVTLPAGKKLDREFLLQVVDREKPAALLVWDDASALPALEPLAGRNGRPQLVFLSSRYLGEGTWSLKEGIRDFVYLTYPYAFSVRVKAGMGKPIIHEDRKQTLKKAELGVKSEAQKLSGQTSALTQLLTGLLMDLKGNYYRDNLLDVAGMMPDQSHPLYGRLNFGTGQRYAARGCYIVQLSKGETPELVKKSEWLTH